MIQSIDAWVLREACLQGRAWENAGLCAKTIVVNISQAKLQSKDFPESLFAILDATGLEPSSLELDISEFTLTKRPERAAFVLKTLMDRGVRVTVDNFGMCNSSLKSLQKLPIHALKIDRSFIRQITTAPNGATIVQALIGLGRKLNLCTIAEGVETSEDLELLWSENCDEAQGNFFCQPVPPERITPLFERA